MRNIFLRVLLLLLVPVGCLPQTNTGKAETRGSCSPANTGNVGQITINCSGMSKEQAQKMVEILNKILANQLDPTQVMSKLDEILHAVDPNRPVTTYEFQGLRRITSPGRVTGDDAAVKNFGSERESVKTCVFAGFPQGRGGGATHVTIPCPPALSAMFSSLL